MIRLGKTITRTIRPGEEFLIDYTKHTCSSTEFEYEVKLAKIQNQMRELNLIEKEPVGHYVNEAENRLPT